MAEPGRLSVGDLALRDEQTTNSSSAHQQPTLADAVEMDSLPPSATAKAESTQPTLTGNADATSSTGDASQQPPEQDAPSTPSAKALGKAPATEPEPADRDAIGPADSTQEPAVSGELAVDIMLILPMNGNRHPFRINEKYLKKRNVNVSGVTEDGKLDPFSITVYTLKELILREWRKEWETPPREPTSIRLIKMGKMLDDKLPLNRKYHVPGGRCVQPSASLFLPSVLMYSV
jgi:hypothetical protein